MKNRTITPIALLSGAVIAIVLNIPKGQNPAPEPLNTCQIKYVIDGDTIACTNDLRIRLCGIDAPEIKQPLGTEAKQALTDLVAGRTLAIAIVDIDRYGRAIAEITTDQNVNVEMARSGFAHHYPQYSSSCPSKNKIIEAESEAKRKTLGVWGDERSVKPWDWRKDKK